MKYVVRYEIRDADSNVRSIGERDVEVGDTPTAVSYRGPGGPFEADRGEAGTRDDPIVARELARQIVIPDGCHAVIVNVRPAP